MNKALDYLIYKSIAIIEKNYPQFKIYKKNYLFIDFISDKDSLNSIKSDCAKVIKDIMKEDSHITLKIRQTLNFICLNSEYHYLDLLQKEVTFKNYEQSLNRIITEQDNKISIIELLPPPIFETDVKIKQNEYNTHSLLSELSSGERQELNSISSVIYHLRNIDSVSDKSLIRYKHINLIFEEIELYFHPEYQRRMISRMLELIGKVKFNSIESINMCFVTHSPFILSDIPKNNVLFLEDGLPIIDRMQENTFGANIHTLLQNGFFLDGVPIGDFAKQKINNIFARLHKGDISTELYNEILLVGEPFIKSQLLNKYNELVPPYSKLKREIDDLHSKLNEIKKCSSECPLDNCIYIKDKKDLSLRTGFWERIRHFFHL